MAELPSGSILVRTWFGEDRAWRSLVREAMTPSREGFLVYATVVNDPEFTGLDPEAFRAKHPGMAAVSFLADEVTFDHPEHPVLAVRVLPPQDFDRGDYRPFRVVPGQLWSVESNINEANLDWRDYAQRVDADGIYRGHQVAKDTDFALDVRSIMGELLIHRAPGLADCQWEIARMAIVPREEDPRTVRERLTALPHYPAALQWDWCAGFDAEHAGDQRGDYIKAFLEEIGERASALGTVLAALDVGIDDYGLVFVTSAQFEELARLFDDHRMSVRHVRRGCWELLTPQHKAAISAWARAKDPKVSARGRLKPGDTSDRGRGDSA